MFKITKLALLLSAGLLGANLCAASTVEFVPGKYIGEANGRNGPMKVEVTVDKNKITNIQVLSHRESAGLSDAPLTQLPKEIIDRQTLKVDNIAGATFSSQGLIKATQNALSKATKDLSPLLLTTLPVKAKKAMKDEKADIVVIGSGIAGLTAAIAAKEKDKNVLVIEKQGMLGAGDSMNISTGITAGGSKFIQEHGIKGKSTQDYVDHLMKQAKDKGIPINKANVETYARRGGEIIDWLEQLGVPFGRFQEDKYFHITKDGSAPGPHIMKALKAEVEKQGIPYRLNSKVTEILSDHGKAIGVEVSTPEGKYKVLSKAVIVATGGFSASPELLKRYAPDWIGRPTTGASSLTGDGIRMAQAIGADTASMEQIKVNYLCHPLTKKDGVSLTAITPYTVLVNHDGKRFVDENHPSINFTENYLKIQQLRYGDIMEYSIDVPDEIKKNDIVKITLQPLVENALYHGLKKQREKGMIKISSVDDENNIFLIVEDNGVGMQPEQVVQINKEMYEDIWVNRTTGFGIANVNRRIKLYYGEEYGLILESEPDIGTKVIVVVPKTRQAEKK